MSIDIDDEEGADGGLAEEIVAVGSAVLAADRFSEISGARVGLIVNRASRVGDDHLVDLVAGAPDVELVALFAPEHGLRSDTGAGQEVADEIDPATGLPVYSLFGQTRQPTPDMLGGIDALVFDLQDVGSRAYTYISTMGLAMQAAAEAGIRFVVLDRPNPQGGRRVDGPVRSPELASFVGQYPIPAVHGMTVGELALAIKGEGWLPGLEDLDLRVIPMSGWRRDMTWAETGLAWVPPSPGLPTLDLVASYPSVVLFEATTLSVGLGTEASFGQVGAPWLDAEALSAELNASGLAGVRFEPTTFTPEPRRTVPDPPYAGSTIPGVRVEVTDRAAIRPMAVAVHLLDAVLRAAGDVEPRPTVIDRPDFFDLLAGDRSLRWQLEDGVDPAVIVEGWQADLDSFEEIRSTYSRY